MARSRNMLMDLDTNLTDSDPRVYKSDYGGVRPKDIRQHTCASLAPPGYHPLHKLRVNEACRHLCCPPFTYLNFCRAHWGEEDPDQ